MKGVERSHTSQIRPAEVNQPPIAKAQKRPVPPDRFDKMNTPPLHAPLLRSGTLSADFKTWHNELSSRSPGDLPQVKRIAQKTMAARESGIINKVLNTIRSISPSFRKERQAYKRAFEELMTAINRHATEAATISEPRRSDADVLPTTKAKKPTYTWSLEEQPSWSDQLKEKSDTSVIDEAAQVLANAMKVPVDDVRGQFPSRADAEAFLRESIPEPLRFGALSQTPEAATSFVGKSHGVPTTWALSAPELAGRYGARSIAGDGSCWLTSGLYSTLSQGLKNDDSAQKLAKSFGDAAGLLTRPDIQSALAGQPGFSSTPEAARALSAKAKSLVQELYALKTSNGDVLPRSIKDQLGDVDQALLMSHSKDAWRVWMSEPNNMAVLRDFASQVMAAKTVENLNQMGVDFKDPSDDSASSARESVSETLLSKSEQGPEALAGLAQLTGIELPYMTYSAGKAPKVSSMISDNPSLKQFADAGIPILLYGPYAKDGKGSQMHYSVLEPLNTP